MSFNRQTRGGSSHHFAFDPNSNSTNTTINNSNNSTTTTNTTTTNTSSMPVTAILFSTTGQTNNNLMNVNIIDINSQQGPISPTNHLNLLERQIWFHGKITRKHAENLLANRPIGSFLVRQSESGSTSDFSLSLVSGSGCVHMRICMKNGEFILGQCSQPFRSIVKMIEHYGKVEVPIKGACHVKLLMPITISAV